MFTTASPARRRRGVESHATAGPANPASGLTTASAAPAVWLSSAAPSSMARSSLLDSSSVITLDPTGTCQRPCAESLALGPTSRRARYGGRVNRVEFRVTGTPISHQSHNKQLLRDWRTAVAAAAQKAMEHGLEPLDGTVEIHVTYYFENGSARIPDEDNLLKPIQDALVGVLYRDDSQVMDGTCRKRDIEQPFIVRYMSQVLADGFVEGEEFVHVVVSDAPDPGVLRP